jgi:DNA-binding transcriptional ArsR family regulator
MIDRIRRDIQNRLEQLLAEVEKLKRALTALDGPRPSPPSPAPRRTQPRERSTRPAPALRAGPATSGTRTARGATRTAVLEGLAKSGEAMTAAQLAAVTGLGRGTVSATLSKLAGAGVVVKADRGYRLPASPRQ